MTATGIVGGDPGKLNKTGYSKGAIVAADATGTLQAVPIGSAAEVLTVDLAAPEDVDWVPPSGGGVASFNGRSGVVVPVSGDYTVGLVTGAAPSASPTFTGTTTQSGRVVATTTTLTDAATILVDASLGNQFTVTLNVAGATRALGNPTNVPAVGRTQMILFAVRQDGAGNRALTFGSDYRFGTTIASITLSTGANKTDYIGVRWNGTDSKWDVIALSQGF